MVTWIESSDESESVDDGDGVKSGNGEEDSDSDVELTGEFGGAGGTMAVAV